MNSPQVVETLLRAADAAERENTLRRAVTTAWSHLHLTGNVNVMGAAFAAWCKAENFESHPSGLGAVLRARYTAPAEIAASLRRAANPQRRVEGFVDSGAGRREPGEDFRYAVESEDDWFD